MGQKRRQSYCGRLDGVRHRAVWRHVYLNRRVANAQAGRHVRRCRVGQVGLGHARARQRHGRQANAAACDNPDSEADPMVPAG